MTTDLTDLRERVLSAVRKGALKKLIEDVAIEPDIDEDGNEFLRVVVKLQRSDGETDADLERALESIEAAVLDVDSRYPSVRFLDAA